LSDGFAFFGGGTRGVLVTGCNEPQVLVANQLRSLMGLGNVSPETALHLEQQRRKENVSRGARKDSRPSSTSRHDDIPKELCCGLTGALMRDPWMASDGFSYERQAIKQWFESRGARSPTTGLALPDMRVVPNNALRSIIDSFTKESDHM